MGINGYGGARTVKIAAAGIVEEWRRLESVVVEGEDGVGGSEVLVYGFWRLVGRRCRWVSLGLFFFFWVCGCGFCDQRRARMAVTGLGGVTGFSAGLGIKNSCGAAGYTRIAEAGLGF